MDFDEFKQNLTRYFYTDKNYEAMKLMKAYLLAEQEGRVIFHSDKSGETCMTQQAKEFFEQDHVKKIVEEMKIMDQYA